jgi:polyphosphate:AMP phosphotransferase
VLPPKGRIGIFFNGWYSEALAGRVLRGATKAEFERYLATIRHNENMLANEGVLVLKFWIHLSKLEFEKRSKKLARRSETRWRLTEEQRQNFKRYDDLKRAAAIALQMTSTASAPWLVVEGVDDRYRNVTIGSAILSALKERLSRKHRKLSRNRPATASPAPDNVIERLDLRKRLTREEYKTDLAKWQATLGALTRDKRFSDIAVIAVFEGQDAAGKGAAIRRVTAPLDARGYEIHAVAAPTEEERAQPYLWRFWRHVPARGRIAIFDRSWYGRLLVERVEGFCAPADWMRGYEEIVDFESRLTEYGIVVVKFWLAISKDEQLRRFKEREKTPFKRFKITAEDWRNRERWDDYVAAVCDVVDRTSTVNAPWTLVEANDKHYARVKVLKTLCSQIKRVL